MISFRYHIVSIVSVFLALAVGVALGGGPLKGEVDNTLVNQVKTDKAEKADLHAKIAELRGSDSFTDEFAATIAPRLVGGTLRGHAVTIVVLPSARESDVSALTKLVPVAGGTVAGTIQVGHQLLDPGRKQFVDELGTQLQEQHHVDVPSDASAYDRLGTLIARAVGTTAHGGARVDSAASGILAGLSAANLMSPENGSLPRRGDLVLFVTGPGEGDQEQQQGAATIVTALVQAVDQHTAGVVLAGPASAARADGQLKAVRDDVNASQEVSTVDSVSRTPGQVVTILALAEQAHGRSGQYGAVQAADGAMPGARASSS